MTGSRADQPDVVQTGSRRHREWRPNALSSIPLQMRFIKPASRLPDQPKRPAV
jgi:hypothetical protein